jgi:hypothetical protein
VHAVLSAAVTNGSAETRHLRWRGSPYGFLFVDIPVVHVDAEHAPLTLINSLTEHGDGENVEVTCRCSRAAATDESTPPDMATAVHTWRWFESWRSRTMTRMSSMVGHSKERGMNGSAGCDFESHGVWNWGDYERKGWSRGDGGRQRELKKARGIIIGRGSNICKSKGGTKEEEEEEEDKIVKMAIIKIKKPKDTKKGNIMLFFIVTFYEEFYRDIGYTLSSTRPSSLLTRQASGKAQPRSMLPATAPTSSSIWEAKLTVQYIKLMAVRAHRESFHRTQ